MSVGPVVFLTLIQRAAQTERDSAGAACDKASVQFGQTIRRTDIVVDTAINTTRDFILFSNKGPKGLLQVAFGER